MDGPSTASELYTINHTRDQPDMVYGVWCTVYGVAKIDNGWGLRYVCMMYDVVHTYVGRYYNTTTYLHTYVHT